MLVFFDNILVYSKSIGDHVTGLKELLSTFQQHKLIAKKSKCKFWCSKVEYLGHLVSKEGVKADPFKLESMLNWSFLETVRSLMSFLGLIGYYRKFVRNYK